MEKRLFYRTDAVFPNQEALIKFIKSRNHVRGKYLLAANNDPKNNFIAFYNSHTNQIELELRGKSIEDLADAENEFFRIVDKLYKSYTP